MKVEIIDHEALAALSPLAIAAYAIAEGWTRYEKFGTHSDVFVRADAPELIIPGTSKIGDYSSVVQDLIRTISVVEGRDEIQVFRDLSGSDRDVIRVRSPDADDVGSIRIDEGVELFLNAREMLLSAACSANDPRPSYRAGKNKEASAYMERVRLGQTEQGSFIVSLLAPVPPSLEPPTQTELWPSVEDEPFDRLVTRTLASGLGGAKDASEYAVRGAGLQAFHSAVALGVSANLCESLGSLIQRSGGIDVSITWAKTRPTPEARRVVEFSREDGEVLKEAARKLRDQEPRPDERVEGYVTGLDRTVQQDEGRITLKTFIDGKPVSVRTRLDPDAYRTAVAAHDEKSAVSMSGDLRRQGQRWWLDHPRILSVSRDEDTSSD